MGPAPTTSNARFVVITGLSGSGKSTALKALEDLGFYAVDNLPVGLLPAFVKLPLDEAGVPFKAALVMDLRSAKFLERFPQVYADLQSQGFNLELLFLEAADQVLISRFSTTRRQHPLVGPGEPLREGIRRERALLEPIRGQANQVLDSSRHTVHDLKREVAALYSRLAPPAAMQLNIVSFGFKNGLPTEADLVMDLRFLPNPYFSEQLRPLDGRDPRVVDFIFDSEVTSEFLNRFKYLLDFLVPRYHQEGKSRLTLALGCTGGKHRSVAVSEWLAKQLGQTGHSVTLRHRDVHLG